VRFRRQYVVLSEADVYVFDLSITLKASEMDVANLQIHVYNVQALSSSGLSLAFRYLGLQWTIGGPKPETAVDWTR
jgi:hypothetical protein